MPRTLMQGVRPTSRSNTPGRGGGRPLSWQRGRRRWRWPRARRFRPRLDRRGGASCSRSTSRSTGGSGRCLALRRDVRCAFRRIHFALVGDRVSGAQLLGVGVSRAQGGLPAGDEAGQRAVRREGVQVRPLLTDPWGGGRSGPWPTPANPHQKKFRPGKNETYQRGSKLETDFRDTNFLLASDPPPPPTPVPRPLSKGLAQVSPGRGCISL